jgi:hypothetical protein
MGARCCEILTSRGAARLSQERTNTDNGANSTLRGAKLMKSLGVLFFLMLAGPQIGAAQQTTAAAAQGQSPGICANQPLCYETADFAATVTDFRTSVSGGYHIVDASLRIQNKTPNQLVLGYNNGSGTALDDQGVRYSVGGGNALRGMGLVNGQSVDPKFSLPPGGYGDVRFELLGGGAQVYGLTYELDITVSEIKVLEGNQHSLGGEFPLQFQGLANGVKGATSGMSAGASGSMAGSSGMLLASTTTSAPGTAVNGAAGPCVPTGAAGALSAAQGAQAVISSLASMFGRNNQAAPAATATTGATNPCVAPAAATASGAGSAATTTSAVTHMASAANTPAATPMAAAKVAVKAPAASRAGSATPQAKKPAGTTAPAENTVSH